MFRIIQSKRKKQRKIALLMMDIDTSRILTTHTATLPATRFYPLRAGVSAAAALIANPARYGGDNFAVLPYTNAKKAARLAENLAQRYKKPPWKPCSAITPYHQYWSNRGHIKDYASVEALIESADQLLIRPIRRSQSGRLLADHRADGCLLLSAIIPICPTAALDSKLAQAGSGRITGPFPAR
jgi:hypothetical protein